jgi:hypothetical protein
VSSNANCWRSAGDQSADRAAVRSALAPFLVTDASAESTILAELESRGWVDGLALAATSFEGID